MSIKKTESVRKTGFRLDYVFHLPWVCNEALYGGRRHIGGRRTDVVAAPAVLCLGKSAGKPQRPGRLFLNSLGLIPVISLKALTKCAESLYPTAWAISYTRISVSSISCFAFSIRKFRR